MNLVKVAQAPEGYIDIEMIFDGKTGQTKTKIIGHGNGASCSLENGAIDEQLLRELLEADVPGFGESNIEDEGKTAEFFEEKQKIKLPAQKQKPENPSNEEEKKKKDRQKAVDSY